MLRTLAAVVFAVVVLVLPGAAFAMNGPGGGSPSTATSGGFGYRDAAVGAAIGVLVLAAAGGTVLVIRHERNGTHVHAGTSV
jgi:hypothetical protein